MKDDDFHRICTKLYSQLVGFKTGQLYASTKQVLALFGTGAVINISYLSSQSGVSNAGQMIDAGNPKDTKEWRRYGTGYLKQSINRLENEGLLKRSKINGKSVMVISDKGKHVIIRYALDRMTPEKLKSWDGKWRIVIYDIDSRKKNEQQGVRNALKNMGFMQLQKSVYITPHTCDKEISYLQNHFSLGSDMICLVADKFEGDIVCRRHFGV